MDDREGETRFDAVRISFPTDRICVGDLIRKYPDSFKWDWLEFCSPDEPQKAFRDLLNAMHAERELAALAFNDALNTQGATTGHASLSSFSHGSSHEDLVSELSAYYQNLGVAHGDAETLELVRRFESAASAQVNSSKSR